MRAKWAFTLVELLVVIALIGVLVALTLPAVQAAREAVRKVSCKNNLKSIGIGLLNYHDVHGALPVGCIEWRVLPAHIHRRQMAWSAMLLPFIEQQPLHNKIDFRFPFDATVNAKAAATIVATYLCPSTPTRVLPRAPTDYGGLFGELIIDRQQDDGIFLYDRRISLHDILDGTSSTLAVSEDVGGPDSEWINGRNVFVQALGINDSTAWLGDNEIRSLHEGGAMTLFVDGHVRFLTESIDRQVLGSLITRHGGEPIESNAF